MLAFPSSVSLVILERRHCQSGVILEEAVIRITEQTCPVDQLSRAESRSENLERSDANERQHCIGCVRLRTMQFKTPHKQSALAWSRSGCSVHVDYLPSLRKGVSEKLDFDRVSVYPNHALRYLRKVARFLLIWIP